ncbi:hypothetical protein RKD23_000254 [Streptomyces sp. SAI-170]
MLTYEDMMRRHAAVADSGDGEALALQRVWEAQASTRWLSASVPGAPSDPLPTDPDRVGGSLLHGRPCMRGRRAARRAVAGHRRDRRTAGLGCARPPRPAARGRTAAGPTGRMPTEGSGPCSIPMGCSGTCTGAASRRCTRPSSAAWLATSSGPRPGPTAKRREHGPRPRGARRSASERSARGFRLRAGSSGAMGVPSRELDSSVGERAAARRRRAATRWSRQPTTTPQMCVPDPATPA